VLGVYEVNESIAPITSIILRTHRVIHNLSDLDWTALAGPLIRCALGIVLIVGNRKVTAYLKTWTEK